MRVLKVKLKAEHFEQLLAQDQNASMRPYFTPEAVKALENNVHSYSLLTASGRVVFCGGVSHYWPNRGEAWGVFDNDAKTYILAIHREVKKFLDELPLTRIEASAKVGFAAAHKWLSALGFCLEAAVMRKYTPDGHDCALYARIKEGAHV